MKAEEDTPILVLCTAPDAETGATLGRRLVETKLAACVNVIDKLRSFYVWQGKIEDDSEVQLFIKTRRSRYEALEAHIRSEHPYDEPEILALPIVAGSRSYLDWLKEQTGG